MKNKMSDMITKEDLSKFDPQVRTMIRRKMASAVNHSAYDQQTGKFILHGILILCEMIFTNTHGKFKGIPKARMEFFGRFFSVDQFSKAISEMVRSGVFYNIDRHTHYLAISSGYDMEKPVLTEYAKLFLMAMIEWHREEQEGL